jgi:hypothetical protein
MTLYFKDIGNSLSVTYGENAKGTVGELSAWTVFLNSGDEKNELMERETDEHMDDGNLRGLKELGYKELESLSPRGQPVVWPIPDDLLGDKLRPSEEWGFDDEGNYSAIVVIDHTIVLPVIS